MARRIQIKRGLYADMPVLAVGELGYCTDINKLFVGTAEGVNREIVGSHDIDPGQIANKQDKLVSGVNIKTVNGESILGGGDIVDYLPFTETIDDASTDKQIPSAKAVNDLVAETALNILNLPHSEEYDLFVYSGQSNMQGYGTMSSLDRTENFYGLEYLKNSDSLVNCKHSSGEGLSGIDPITETSFACFGAASKGNGNYILNGELVEDSPIPAAERGGASMPPYFAKAYNRYGKKSINMHIALAASGICEWIPLEDTIRINAMEQFKPIFEKPNGFDYDNLTSEDPAKRALAERMHRGYVRNEVMIDKINSGIAKFAQEYPTSTIRNKVFVWHQGERDADQCVLSDTQENITLSKELYKERFLALWNSLKTESGFDYALIVRVGFWGNEKGSQIIMAAQEELALEHEDIFMATRIASYFPNFSRNADTGVVTVGGFFANKTVYPDCMGTRDTYYGVSNSHIGEKGFRLMAEKTAESAYRILHLKQPPLLEPEQTDAFDYVEIKTPLESFTMNLSSNQIGKGSTVTASFLPTPAVFKGSIQLTVEPSAGVTVQDNKITFADAGNYTVTATYSEDNTIKQTALVEVIEATMPVTGVSLDRTTLVLDAGRTDVLLATVLPVNATDRTVYWTSTSPSIATVSNGLVTGIAEGVATITVTTQDGSFTQSCNVTINAAPIQEDILFLDLRTPLESHLNESVGTFTSNGDAVYDAEIKAYLLNPVKTKEEQTLPLAGFTSSVSVDIIPASGQSRDITIAFGGYRAEQTFIFKNSMANGLWGDSHNWFGGQNRNFALRSYAPNASDIERSVRINDIFQSNDVAHRIYLMTLTLSETSPCNIVVTEYSQDLTTNVLTEVGIRDMSPVSNAANNQAIIKDLKLHNFFTKWGSTIMQPNDAFATFLRVKEGTRTLQEMAPWLYE